MCIRFRHGVTRIEMVTLLVCAIILLAIGSIVLGQADNPADKSSFKAHARTVQDATQLRGIHQAWLVFSREFNGIFPTPGLIDRLPFNGVEEPGRGEEDKAANTTANLFSVCIMNNLFTPEILISPVERNPKVKAATEAEYDYTKYSVPQDCYWDKDFKADLKEGSNVSYAHLPIYGQWQAKAWRDTSTERIPIVGSRGPKDGVANPDSYTCGPHGNWAGNIIFNGAANQVFYFEPATTNADGTLDNFFATPDVNGLDCFISFTREIKPDGPVFQFD